MPIPEVTPVKAQTIPVIPFHFLVKMGVLKGTLFVTLVAVVCSLLITSICMAIFFGKSADWLFGLGVAILAPVLCMPVFSSIILRLIHQLDQAWQQLHRLAYIDELTGVYNRRHFMSEAAIEFDKARRYGLELAIIMLDADEFKRINDRHGHACGDEVLRHIATACQLCLRSIDILARYGGEEFVVLLPVTDLQSGRTVAERICANVKALRINHGSQSALQVTISLGVAALTPQTATLDVLLSQADEALYRAKRNGRDQVQVSVETPQLFSDI